MVMESPLNDKIMQEVLYVSQLDVSDILIIQRKIKNMACRHRVRSRMLWCERRNENQSDNEMKCMHKLWLEYLEPVFALCETTSFN